MNKFSLFVLLLLTAGVAACSSEESHDVVPTPTAIVAEGPAFLDLRDSAQYRTIRVGNQIWLAENLRYALPGYSIDGAYTYGEKVIDKSQIRPTNDEVIALIESLANDPSKGGWPVEFSPGTSTQLTPMIVAQVRNYRRGRLTYANVISFLDNYATAFKAELDKTLLSYATVPAVKARVGKAHFLSAEESNGGYVAQYGFLYSYEAALAAVPDTLGWRLPSDADWTQLEQNLGASTADRSRLEAWSSTLLGKALSVGGTSGFNAPYAGGNTYRVEAGQHFNNKGRAWYYWSSTLVPQNDSVSHAMIRLSDTKQYRVWRGTSPLSTSYRPVLYSVRLVRDVKD